MKFERLLEKSDGLANFMVQFIRLRYFARYFDGIAF